MHISEDAVIDETNTRQDIVSDLQQATPKITILGKTLETLIHYNHMVRIGSCVRK